MEARTRKANLLMSEVKPWVSIVSWTQDPERVIETAYLQCRESAENIESKRGKSSFTDRLQAIFTSKPAPHFGPLEHASATIQITGISRTASHQLVRHRIASYCQMSQRAVPAEKMGVCIPPEFDSEDRAMYLSVVELSLALYNKLVKKGRKLEDARFTLVNGMETQIVVTMNFRSWLHFLKLRLDPSAQWEIRQVAEEIWVELKTIAPNVFDERFREYWE
jgi:thymidylate synthase (FAD)